MLIILSYHIVSYPRINIRHLLISPSLHISYARDQRFARLDCASSGPGDPHYSAFHHAEPLCAVGMGADQVKPAVSTASLYSDASSSSNPSSTSPDGTTPGERVLKKIDWRFLPLLFLTYSLNFMDKTLLSNASVFGLREDTVYLPPPESPASLPNQLSASQRRRIQLGFKCLLFRLSLLGIPNVFSDPETPYWKICRDQHPVLGHRRRSDCGMHELWWSYHRPIPAGRSRGHDLASIRSHNLHVVYSRRNSHPYGNLVCGEFLRGHFRRFYCVRCRSR